MVASKEFPKLSVIVPSFNQGGFIEETLLSIINQQYPRLELIVIDGGSTDNTVEVLKKYDSRITHWISEKDRGQSHAINKGLEKATGEWVAWMNSDDCYLDGALQYIFGMLPHQEYDFLYGHCCSGQTMASAVEHRHPVKAKEDLFGLLQFFYHVSHIIPSQSVFIRRSILGKVGLLNESLHYCMDLDWFCRIFLYTDKRLFYEKTICFYRTDLHTKTANNWVGMTDEAIGISKRYMHELDSGSRDKLLEKINYFILVRQCSVSKHLSFFPLFKIAVRFPLTSLFDIRYRILVKKFLKRNVLGTKSH